MNTKMNDKCRICFIDIHRTKGDIKNGLRIYCSLKCRGLGKRNRVHYKCEMCNKKTSAAACRYKKSENHFCSCLCRAKFKSRQAFESAVGFIDSNGYRVIHAKLEHRLIMEKILGRRLQKKESVHHKNGKRADNKPKNLELFISAHGPGQRLRDLRAYLRTIPKRLGGLK